MAAARRKMWSGMAERMGRICRHGRGRVACIGLLFAGVTALVAGLGLGAYLYVATAEKPALIEGVPFSTAYYDRDGRLLRLSLAQDGAYRLFTPLEDFSPDLLTATLIQEDRYFNRHFGVNPWSLLRGAAASYVFGGRRIGGSTITMQLVRMRDGLDTRSLSGKWTQIVRAIALERHYDKAQILEAYVNLAPYGGNIHGAGTAALIYFGQKGRDLTLPQSISLAVIPQNPVKRNPENRDNSAWQDAKTRLFERFPEPAQARYGAYMAMPIQITGRADLPFRAPHFVDGIAAASPDMNGSVVTSLDPALQAMVEHHIAAYVRRHSRSGLDNAAAMIVHTPTMQIRALAGSADFHDPRIAGQVDGTAARRSPGSTLKPFVYALAIEQGLIHPESLLEDDRSYFGEYRPGNFDRRFIGQIPAREALGLSRNIPAITLAARVHSPDLYQFLQDGGAGFPQGRAHYGLSIVLGGAEIDMRRLVRLYAMLANGGRLRPLSVLDGSVPKAEMAMISPETAYVTLSMLDRAEPDVTAFAPPRLSIPAYWKTGTSNGFRDAWTVGVFGPYVIAVWAGHFDGRPNPALVGAESAAPLFFDLAAAVQNRAAATGKPLRDLIAPAMAALAVAQLPICTDTGRIAVAGADNGTHCGMTRAGLFIPGRSPFAAGAVTGREIEILSPRSGLDYTVRLSAAGAEQAIPLEARAAAYPVYWYAGSRLIGMATSNTPLFWQPAPGVHTIRAVGAAGQSDSRVIRVLPAR